MTAPWLLWRRLGVSSPLADAVVGELLSLYIYVYNPNIVVSIFFSIIPIEPQYNIPIVVAEGNSSVLSSRGCCKV